VWSYVTLHYILPVLSTEYYTLYITRHYLLIYAYAYVLVMCCESLVCYTVRCGTLHYM